MLLRSMSQRELVEVALEVIVTANDAVLGDHQHFLILGPSEPPDGPMLPRDRFDELSGARVEVYTGL